MWQLREISNGEKWSNNKSGQLDEYFDHVSEGRKGFLHHLMNMETFTATARVGLLLLSFLLTQVNPQDPALTALLPPEPPSPTQGGSVIFLYQGERNLYGNNVTYRIADLPTDSMKCWVDFETPLPSGIISRFHIYIHNISASLIDPPSRCIRLQIWWPDDLTIPRYMLVWQQLVVIDSTFSSTYALYTYRLNTAFAVDAGDRIGWTNECRSAMQLCIFYCKSPDKIYIDIDHKISCNLFSYFIFYFYI